MANWKNIKTTRHNFIHREGADIVFYTSPQSLSIFRWIYNFGDFYWTFIGCLNKLSVQTFQSLILIYRSGNFVCHHWGCTWIHLPLPYPFRSLFSTPYIKWISNSMSILIIRKFPYTRTDKYLTGMVLNLINLCWIRTGSWVMYHNKHFSA